MYVYVYVCVYVCVWVLFLSMSPDQIESLLISSETAWHFWTNTHTHTSHKRGHTAFLPIFTWIFNMGNNISATSHLPFIMTCCVSLVFLCNCHSAPLSLSLSSNPFTSCTNNIWHFAWSPRMWWLRPNDNPISPLPTVAATFLTGTPKHT